mmetsp:Transcript_9166/g.1366  ORF Transcript_9166/g.1366 Transcript_9166/m.1366 type:complete len:93 (+) Transcript_9166:99-377(+)
MQRLWRSYGNVRLERYNNILTIWNNVINELTVGPRGRLKNGSDKYFKITSHARNQVINDYLLDCRRRYRALFRKHFKQTSDILKMGVKAFIM